MVVLIATVMAMFVPRMAFACPVCFGQNDSPLALGINYGIYLMLGVIVLLWAAFASFFIYLKRRASLAESGALSPAKAEGTT